MTNTKLLNYNGPSELLTSIEKQERFILRENVQRRPCPNCAAPVNVFDATGVEIDDYDFSEGKPEVFHCPNCKRELRYILPLQGGWHWWLKPEEVKP